MEMVGSLFALLLFAGGCCGLRWREELRGEGEPVTLCSGHSLRLFWNFTLDPGEYLKGIVWSCEPEREHEDIMATYMDGHFVPRAAFSGRLAHLQDGAIELSCTTILESGNYSIEVSTEDANSHLTVHRKTVAVTVFDKPKTQTGEFHVTRKEEAVRDVITGAWHVQLSCGNFSDLGHPPVDVIWTTPKGAQLTSTGFQHGMFYLMVPNPATGGTYTCTIPASQPAARCLERDSPLRDTASVNLDEVMVKLLLLEARHQEFMDRTEARHQEFMDRTEARLQEFVDSTEARLQDFKDSTEARQQEFKDSLKAERDLWMDAVSQMGNRTEARLQELKNSLKAERGLWMDAIGHMENRTEAQLQVFEIRTEARHQELENRTEARHQELKNKTEDRHQELETRTEARHQEFEDRIEALQQECENRTGTLHQEFKDSLETERNVLKDAIGQMANRTEARHQDFEDRTEALQQDLRDKTEALQQELKDSLKAEKDDWMDVIGQMENRTEALQKDFKDSLKAERYAWRDAIGQMGNRTEARHQEFKDNFKAAKNVWKDAIGQMGNRTEARHQEFEDSLKAAKNAWKDAIGQMGNRTDMRYQEFEDSLKAAKNVWMDAIGQMGKRTEVLEQWRDDAVRNSAPVSFHARLTSNTDLSYGDILKLDNVISNQGGGYNSTTGYFTAPVSGTYFFIGTTAPYGIGNYANMALIKERSVLAWISLHQYSNYNKMGSCHAAVYLNAGQRVWLDSRGTSYLSSYRTAFSGFKLR